MYVKCNLTGFEVVKEGRNFQIIYYYNVLKSPLIDHLQPTLSFKILINFPRINQNQPGEVWCYIEGRWWINIMMIHCLEITIYGITFSLWL